MTETARLLLLSGSTRHGSINTAVLRTAQALTPVGMVAELYDGINDLPAFDPDDDHEPLPPAVDALRRRLGAADAVLVCTPEYAGALPGSFKNLLDWTVGGGEFYGKPVAWINASSAAAPTGGADAHASLQKVLGYVGAHVVDAGCLRLPLSRAAMGADGMIVDSGARTEISAALDAIGRFLAGDQPARPAAPFSTRVIVRGYELDTQGHLNQAVYLQYAEHARWELLRLAGISQNSMIDSGIGPVVLETTIRYERELRGGDEIDVTCQFRWREGKVFDLDQLIVRTDGVVAAKVSVVAGFLDLRRRVLVADPAARLAKLVTRPELVGL